MADVWPQSAADSIGTFLTNVRTVGQTDAKDSKLTSTPFSLQVMQSDATALTKVWATLVGFAGGGASLWAFIEGLLSNVTSGPQGPWIRIALIGAGGILGSAVAVSLAIIVRGDVSSRAHAHAARQQAEGVIVSAILANYNFSWPTGWIVRKTDGTFLPISNFNRTANGDVVITTASGDKLVPSDYDGIIAASQLMASLARTP